MNNENNNNNNNIEETGVYLSQMDEIFIPEDLDENINLEDLVTYKCNVKGFRVVPENYRLVKKNIFTQVNKNVYGYGVKFLAPLFTKTILVPKYSGIMKNVGVKAFANDGEELTADFSVVMRISNPAKYVVEGKNKYEELDSLISRLFRIYVSSRNFETIMRGICEKKDFDLNDELIEFQKKYGIEIEKILIEKVEMSENLKKLYNDAIEEKQKRLAQAERLAAEKEKAQNDAELAKISYEVEAAKIKTLEDAKNNAYVDRITRLVEKLKEKGFSNESIESYIQTIALADSGNAIFMGNNLEAQNIASGIVGGNKVKSKQKTK